MNNYITIIINGFTDKCVTISLFNVILITTFVRKVEWFVAD